MRDKTDAAVPPAGPGTAAPYRRGNGRTDRPPYDLDAVVDIAVATFNERGYEASSISVLADRLGTSKSALYYHVSGKEELLARALGRALDALERALDAAAASGGTGADRLERALRGAVGVLVDELPSVTLLLRVRGNTDVEREALRRRRAVDHRLSELVAAARAEGSVRDDLDAGTVSRLLFGMINSLVEWYRPDGPLSPDALADTVVAVAFEGLRG